MTGVETSSDVEVIEALEFEPQEPCCKYSCEEPAAWTLTCKACGHPWLYCEPHMKEHRASEMWYTHVACAECRGRWRVPAADHFWILPIGGSL